MGHNIGEVDIEYFYPSVEEVLAVFAQEMGIPVSSCRDYVHSHELLESALNRPKDAALYCNASLCRQAAILLWGLIHNHPFRDGNKRTAWIVTQAFLRGQNVEIVADEETKFEWLIRTAKGEAALEEVEKWINTSIDPWMPGP